MLPINVLSPNSLSQHTKRSCSISIFSILKIILFIFFDRYSFSYGRIANYFMMAFAPPKSTDGPKMQTKMSTWTPLNHQLLNDQVSDQSCFISWIRALKKKNVKFWLSEYEQKLFRILGLYNRWKEKIFAKTCFEPHTGSYWIMLHAHLTKETKWKSLIWLHASCTPKKFISHLHSGGHW